METPTIIRLLRRSTFLKGESLRSFGDSCGRITTTLGLIPLVVTIAQFTIGNTDNPATMLATFVLFSLLAGLNLSPLKDRISTRARLSLVLVIFLSASAVIFLRHGTSVAGSLFLIPLVPVGVLLFGLATAAILTTLGISSLLAAELIIGANPVATAITLAVVALFTSWMTAAFTAVILEMLDDQLIKTERTLENFKALSTTDALTGITNRRGFDEKLSSEINASKRTGSPVSVAMIDIDNFKKFNDTHGHPKGDKALQRVAKVLSANLYRSTDLVARYGGEEFAIIMPHTSLEDAAMVAMRLRETIEEVGIKPPYTSQNPITVSVGVASMAGRSLTPEEIVQLADAALYKSKETGRNRVNMINPDDQIVHVVEAA